MKSPLLSPPLLSKFTPDKITSDLLLFLSDDRRVIFLSSDNLPLQEILSKLHILYFQSLLLILPLFLNIIG